MIDKSSLQAIATGIVFVMMLPTIFGAMRYTANFPNAEPEQGAHLIASAATPWWIGIAGVSTTLLLAVFVFFVAVGRGDLL